MSARGVGAELRSVGRILLCPGEKGLELGTQHKWFLYKIVVRSK